jgi:hypothetical protein
MIIDDPRIIFITKAQGGFSVLSVFSRVILFLFFLFSERLVLEYREKF